MSIALDHFEVHDLPNCDCCGRGIRGAAGFAMRGKEAWVAYSVSYVPDNVPAHGAALDFSFPAWDGEPLEGERVEARLELHVVEGIPGLFLANAPGGLARDEILTTELHEQLIELTRVLWANDPNLDEIRSVLKRPVLASEPPPEDVTAPHPSTDKSHHHTQVDDLTESSRLAGENWSRFVACFDAQDGETFLVKKLYEDGGQRELLWSVAAAFDAGVARGPIATEPEVVGHVQAGQEVTVSADEAADWVVIKHGETYAGGYSDPAESPEERARRATADRCGLPSYLLVGFGGVDLRAPLPDLSSAFYAGADRTPLRRPAVRVLLGRTKPTEEVQELQLSADDGATLHAEELLRKIHAAARGFLEAPDEAYLGILLCVGEAPTGEAAYAVLTGPDPGGLVAGAH